MQTRIVFCSDIHLCDRIVFGRTGEDRTEDLISKLNAFYEEKPFEKIVFLGDYSLDHHFGDKVGNWLEYGISDTDRFVKEYVPRLPAPSYLMPGNHELYGNALWQKIVGTPRQDYFVVGGYLIICCDNFDGILDPTEHCKSVSTPTDLAFVRKAMAEYPCLPVILCAHDFDRDIEPEEFYEFLKNEKRITLLIQGHEHTAEIYDLGEKADHVCVYYDGHYGWTFRKQPAPQVMWGFCEAILTDEGVDIRYIEPENDYILNGEPYHQEYREQNHRFFPRRDL